MWKEAVVDKFDVVSWHLHGGSEENQKRLDRIAGLWADTGTRNFLYMK
jgi:hypothetical protein